MNTPIDICSIGHIAQMLQQPVARIRVVAAQLALVESRLNDVAYFNAGDVERLRAAMTMARQARDAAILDPRANIM